MTTSNTPLLLVMKVDQSGSLGILLALLMSTVVVGAPGGGGAVVAFDLLPSLVPVVAVAFGAVSFVLLTLLLDSAVALVPFFVLVLLVVAEDSFF